MDKERFEEMLTSAERYSLVRRIKSYMVSEMYELLKVSSLVINTKNSDYELVKFSLLIMRKNDILLIDTESGTTKAVNYEKITGFLWN